MPGGNLRIKIALWAGVVALVGGSIALAGCPEKTTAPAEEEKHYEVEEGTIGGALFAIYMPDEWNGKLILYAHGYVSPYDDVTLPDGRLTPWVEDLAEDGYAVAYSSYEENGLAIESGARSTDQLRDYFWENYGRPSKTFVVGHSMGGIVVVRLMEEYGENYDGGLAICGMVGGSLMQLRYIGDFRAVYDYFSEYHLDPPEKLAGSLNDPVKFGNKEEAESYYKNTVLPHVDRVFESTDVGGASLAEQISATTGVPQKEDAFAGVLWYNLFGARDILERSGGNPYDNSNTTYKGSQHDEDLNGKVERVEADPAAVQYIEENYTPTGRISRPLILLHTNVDPIVPVDHVYAYRDLVRAEGNEGFLLTRVVDSYGHCPKDLVDDTLKALDDLVEWAESGIKPES